MDGVVLGIAMRQGFPRNDAQRGRYHLHGSHYGASRRLICDRHSHLRDEYLGVCHGQRHRPRNYGLCRAEKSYGGGGRNGAIHGHGHQRHGESGCYLGGIVLGLAMWNGFPHGDSQRRRYHLHGANHSARKQRNGDPHRQFRDQPHSVRLRANDFPRHRSFRLANQCFASSRDYSAIHRNSVGHFPNQYSGQLGLITKWDCLRAGNVR